MTTVDNPNRLRMRPHHLFCNRFLPLEKLSRGDEFLATVNRLNELTQTDSDLVIIITEGPDELCNSCPEYKNKRCENPLGNEEKVRKWDAKIIAGLDIFYGKEMTVTAFLSLIREKAPLDFCRDRCPWKPVCAVFNGIP
jgi:hypothetical protein